MGLLTADIETLPSDRPEPTGEQERSEFLAEALDGAKGRILCISYINELKGGGRREGVLGWDEQKGRFDLDEPRILRQFWEMMAGFSVQFDRVVGHNVMGFDWPFIIKRSRVHGIRPSRSLSLAKYRSQPFYDTMMEWDQWAWQSRSSLDTVAKALGLGGKAAGMDGSQVYPLWKDGRHREIYDYALQDARLTRAAYGRMVFEGPAPMAQPASCP
jgi:3'-5' exonuclease